MRRNRAMKRTGLGGGGGAESMANRSTATAERSTVIYWTDSGPGRAGHRLAIHLIDNAVHSTDSKRPFHLRPRPATSNFIFFLLGSSSVSFFRHLVFSFFLSFFRSSSSSSLIFFQCSQLFLLSLWSDVVLSHYLHSKANVRVQSLLS